MLIFEGKFCSQSHICISSLQVTVFLVEAVVFGSSFAPILWIPRFRGVRQISFVLVWQCRNWSVGWPVLAMFCPVSLPLGPDSPCDTDGVPPVLSEAEETVSVSSCFASEDTTEDSGVMSSPSDIISLDSQHDSTKFKDKWTIDQEDCSDQDLAGTPELGPQKSPSWERNVSGNWQPRWVTGQLRRDILS